MKKISTLVLLLALMMPVNAKKYSPYVIATDYVKADGKTDCADALQKMIDENPHRTLYFPDGVYVLSHSLKTPANPEHAVHLVLANFATLKAAESWQKGSGALLCLGASEPFNNITLNGSNYGLEGGILDGSGVADGVSIDSGRETRINHVSIKNVQVGLHIKSGANNGSSDADIIDVNIVGNDDAHAIGVLIEGYDNTLTNMRISHVNVGVSCQSGGNSMKNIHPLYCFAKTQDFESSVGFIVRQSNNWLDYCYSDQFATGFKLGEHACCNLTDCFAWWYSGKVPFQTAIACEGGLDAFVSGLHVGFSGDCEKVSLLLGEEGGNGCLEHIYMHRHVLSPEDVSPVYRR